MRPRLIALAAALLLVSMLGVGAALGKAETETVRATVSLSTTEFVPCAANGAGERVTLTGTLRLFAHSTANSRHNLDVDRVSFKGSGTGLTTGDKYQMILAERDIENRSDGAAGVDMEIVQLSLIGQGPENNLVEHLTLHVTENANGELTAIVDNEIRTTCK